jgi:hypothetical protein
MKLTPNKAAIGVRIDGIDYGVICFPRQTPDARTLKAFSE